MPPSLFFDTVNMSSKFTASTFSATLPPYHLNSIATSSTTTELFKSELHNVETSSSQISPVSMTCKSNGSATQLDLPQVSPQSPEIKLRTKRVPRDNIVLPVKG
jgi:hypothetical protein